MATIFSQATKTLDHLCKEIQDKTTCTNLVKYFEHTEAELKLDSTLLSGRIHKRAAIDLVGNIAHSLFGVLDSEYAKNMADTISQVKGNEEHLLSLLKNQTSVIDATINIMKSDQEEVKQKFNQINSQIRETQNMIKDEYYQEKTYQTFLSLCIQLSITASNLQRTQSLIMDILTSTHHGIISPLLLTPHQLQQEVKKIKLHLSESLELPVNQDDTLQLYKLMKIKGGLTNNTVIFRITLPLIERNSFEIFSLNPVPRWINNTLVAIKPCAPLLSINIIQNQYFTLSEAEFNSCSLITDDIYLCSKGQIRHQQGSPTCSCELSLFHNKTASDCPLQLRNDNSTWIALRHQNKWIYAVSMPSQLTVVCKKEITQFTLEESGLITLPPECTLKHNYTTIQGQQVISNSIKSSYTSFWQLSKQGHEERMKPLLNNINTSQYESQIKNLTKLQTSLATEEIMMLPNKIEAHNYHHMSVGYTALIMTIAILTHLVIKRKCKKRPTPIPTPRKQQPNSEFTVHI